ncbi:MAG: allantoate amidohydrolase [Roseovarius pacificus]|nr:allantoate amidohydrolase [Roseovarius pacificus]
MSSAGENLRVNGDRLWESLMEMARIGPGVAGGNNRQTLTDEDGEGRALFQSWCEAAGCSMGVDGLGNMFARREGTDPDALPVYVGSHLDTQPTGGKYDGVLGVLGGLEIVRTLNDLGIRTKHPIVVTNWTNEEGTRFAPAMLASGVFAGVHEQAWAEDRTDAEGRRFGDELDRIGWRGEEEVGARKMHAFFELHIEQGPILEAEGKDIGVVTHGQGLNWTQVTITGKDAHTGSTPMPMRRNAGLAMARVLEKVEEIALSHAPDAVGAAGHIDIFPNLAQRDPRQGGVHGGFPLAAAGGDRGHGRADEGGGDGDLRRYGLRGGVRDRRRVRPGGVRQGLRRGGARGGRAAGLFASRPGGRGRGTMHAGSTAWRRRRW